MSDGLVWKDQGRLDGDAPAAHAVVIGVGDYPHLVDGSGALTDRNGGLRQLSSPPQSARLLAAWLLDEFNHPAAPLASLSLLVSDPAPAPFAHSALAAPAVLAVANSTNVIQALRSWKQRGDSHDDNLMLFFFCGHGVARGLDGLTLLLSDYGESSDMPMEGAIDFAAFQRGMAQCRASRQCFFVDACRQVSDIATTTSETGQRVIQDNIHRPHASDWNYAVLFSTVEGEMAYGRRGKPSFYTEELIRGLNGTGAPRRNAQGDWWVTTGGLTQAIHRGLSLRGPRIRNPAVRLVEFEFHKLKAAPRVPVTVSWRPREDDQPAVLTCERGGAVVETSGPTAEDWTVELPFGIYDFSAQAGSGNGRRAEEPVLPPFLDVEIEVQP